MVLFIEIRKHYSTSTVFHLLREGSIMNVDVRAQCQTWRSKFARHHVDDV